MFKLAGVSAKFFGTALLNAIPFFGQIIFFGGIAIDLFKKLKNAIVPTSRALEELKEITDALPDKFSQLSDKLALAETEGAKQIATYKASAGILQEFTNVTIKAGAEAENLANKIADSKIGKKFQGEILKEGSETLEQLREKLKEDFDTKAFKKLQKSVKEIFADTSGASDLLQKELVKGIREAGGEIDEETGKIGKNTSFKQFEDGVKSANVSVKDVNTNIVGLQKNVADSERVFAKFFEKFTAKTEFDDLVSTFSGFEEQIVALTEADKGEAVQEILDKLGTGAKKFGITAENAAKQIPILNERFRELREDALNLKKDLKLLDSEIDGLKAFEKVSVSAATALFNKQQLRIAKEIEGLEKERQRLKHYKAAKSSQKKKETK